MTESEAQGTESREPEKEEEDERGEKRIQKRLVLKKTAGKPQSETSKSFLLSQSVINAPPLWARPASRVQLAGPLKSAVELRAR